MIREYDALTGTNGFFNTLARFPAAIINFLQTSDGQLSAAVFALVLLLLYVRRR
ncbi:MAG: hypothetical protein ACXW1W_11030 [Methylococcaceae bacterium]